MNASRRWLGLALLASGLLPLASPAYEPILAGGNLVRWQATSPAGIWTDATKTLSWAFNPLNFPQANWPTVAQAGAAFQNAYQSYEDALGSSFRMNRLPNTTGGPASSDGELEMFFTPDETSDHFGFDISGSYAVTFMVWNNVTGALQDADVEFNGDPDTFTWSTQLPTPGGASDVEVTQIHEGLHSLGSGHPIYLIAALWPTGRLPEDALHDRCLYPDDRVLLRTLYPEAPLLGTITGQVNLSAGGACVAAVVVATNSDGLPIATQVTSATGAFSINVPAGTYDVTVHHHMNVDYDSDIDFSAASNFLTATTLAGVVVTAGNTTAGGTITATSGVPTQLLAVQSVSPSALGTQALFLAKGASGTIQLRYFGTAFATAQITSLSFGPGITAGAPAAVAGAGFTTVTATYSVAAGAVAGVRTTTLLLTSGERVMAPGAIEVLDTGTLALAAGPANPAASSVAVGATSQPLLQATLTAGAVEDVRIRQLQFSLAGTGGTMTDVRLYRDVNADGAVDGGDVRIFSGAAFASNPIAETKSATPAATITFDNIALPVLAGTTATLLLVGDLPASGTGTFTASLAAASITSHGMFYGDAITPTGGPATGGTLTISQLAASGLGQFRTTGGAAIAVGGFTPETQVTLRGTVTASSGTVGFEVEVQPIGTAFTNVATLSSATTFASGSTISLNVTPLVDLTAYHWQARALSSVFAASSWASFGSNAETETDFSVDTSVTNPPTGLGQFETTGSPAVAVGGTVKGAILLSATNGTNTGGQNVRLEVEVQPVGTAFANAATTSSALGASGAAASVIFSGATADYHWQARTVSQFGSSSAWVNFDPAALHFHLDAVETFEASAGCTGAAASRGPWALWLAAGLGLGATAFLRRRRADPRAAALLLVLAAAGAAQADDLDLPRSLSAEPPPAARPFRSWGSVGGYIGALIMDTEFEAVHTDFNERSIVGTGTAVAGVEATFNLHEDWRIGAAVEMGLWKDIQIFGAGPILSWRFAASHVDSETGRSDTEHHLRIGGLYQTLDVTESAFGDFDATFTIRAGYELRVAIGGRWAAVIGVEYRHGEWDYDPTIVSGDDTFGGSGVLVSFGLAWLP